MALKVQNVQAGYYDKFGFHPLRASADYSGEGSGGGGVSRLGPKSARTHKPTVMKKWRKAAQGKITAGIKRAKRKTKTASRKKNPSLEKLIPTKWIRAKVKRIGKKVQVMLSRGL